MLAQSLVQYLQQNAAGLIRSRAKILTHQLRTQVRAEDLFQEIIVRMLAKLPGYNARRNHLNAFFKVGLDSCIRNISRDWRAAKRFTPGTVSLEGLQQLAGETSPETVEIGERQADRRLGVQRLSEAQASQLRKDVASLLAHLSPKSRRLAEFLLQDYTPAEIVRFEGVSRGAIYQRIARLRGFFIQLSYFQ